MRFSFNQLERLFSSHQHEFFVAALSITRNAAAAEDVVHDALLAVATLTTPPENLKAYVYRVIRNKALHQTKQAQRVDDSGLDLDYIDRLSLNELDFEERIFVEQALGKLATLEGNHQQVLLLKFFADLSFKDIAEIMDSPMNTVSSWYRRGLQQLQEKLDE
jgi:RNA polymerase sigma-70 factor (ECF subfamily)